MDSIELKTPCNRRLKHSLHTEGKFLLLVRKNITLITLLLPVIPASIYAVLLAYQLGQCFFFNISFSSYLGLTSIGTIGQITLVVGATLGIISLNTVLYFTAYENLKLALIFIVSLIFSSIFMLSIIFKIYSFSLLVSYLQLSSLIILSCTLTGTILGLLNRIPRWYKHQKYKHFYKSFLDNKAIQLAFIISILYVLILSIAYISGLNSALTQTEYSSVTVDQKEYIVIFEGPSHYQLSATLPSTETVPEITILKNCQMKIIKENILVTKKAFYLYKWE